MIIVIKIKVDILEINCMLVLSIIMIITSFSLSHSTPPNSTCSITADGISLSPSPLRPAIVSRCVYHMLCVLW